MNEKDKDTYYQVPAKRQKTVGARTAEKVLERSPESVKKMEEERRGENLPGENMQADELLNREYKIENTVIVNAEGSDIDVNELLDSVEDLCGVDTIMGCVPCGNNTFEVTMINKDCSNNLVPGFQVGDMKVSANSANDQSTFVSILHLPTYMTDEDLVEKIESFGVQVVSPVYRRYYRRENGIRKIEDGTRYFRVKFSNTIKSLPWSIAFHINGVTKYFKTIHDNQSKVCFKCCSEEHLARDCKLSQCYTCFLMGHISINCPKKWCPGCEQRREKCECDSDNGSDSDSGSDSEMEDDSNTDMEASIDEDTEGEYVNEDTCTNGKLKQTHKKDNIKGENDRKDEKQININSKIEQKTETVKGEKGKTEKEQKKAKTGEMRKESIEKTPKRVEEKQRNKERESRHKIGEQNTKPIPSKAENEILNHEMGDNQKDNVKSNSRQERRPKMKFQPNLDCARKKDTNT